jgi:hypothetical protein
MAAKCPRKRRRVGAEAKRDERVVVMRYAASADYDEVATESIVPF